MAQKDVGNKIPIYKFKTTKEIMKYYDEWGKKNKYDKDMLDWNYSGPQETVNVFKKYALNTDLKILDAGCGTGLVGIELKKFGYTNIDGVDLSQKLLGLVPKGYYNKLEQVDLNKSIKIKDNIYDAIMCVGTFTFGHVKAHTLDEFVRITKKKGLICFTINEGIYKEYCFDKKIEELKKNKKWNIKEFFKSDYIKSKDVNAWLCLAEVIK
tara:strand:- start:406 stop:1035 length:630 start_codon:yes stop_codon:yes gene_type:complete